MVVWVRNFQRKVLLSEWILKLHSTFLLEALGAGKYDVSIVCTENREIQALNRRYRRVDAPTDVLSFPYHEVFMCLLFSHSLGLGHVKNIEPASWSAATHQRAVGQ